MALTGSCVGSQKNFRTYQSQDVSAVAPNLNPIDFYLWRFLAAEVFDRRSQSIIDIKEAVHYFANSIEPKTVAEVVKNFQKRINLC